jgi:two-component system, OmpR family, phosphate regulon sensor histidine kinase PhoR
LACISGTTRGYQKSGIKGDLVMEGDINIQALWRDVFADLEDVFDIHFVCATFSRRVAEHTGVGVALAIADEDGNYFDIWHSDPSGETRQLRWDREDARLENFFSLRQLTYLDKLDRPAVEVINSRLWLLARQFLLVVPLVSADRLYQASPPALIALIDPPDTSFLQENLSQEISQLARVFLDRATLRQTVDRRTMEFTLVSDISHALSATLNVQEIYRLLTGPIRQMLNVETLSVGLIDSITGDIVFVEQLLGPLFSQMPPIRVKRNQGIAGWVAENRESVIVNDTYTDQRFFAGVDRRSGFQTHSMICIPLQVEERTIGVLQAINRRSGKFDNHDLQLMQALGGPLAAAIENARLHSDVLAEKRRIETIFSSMSEGLVTINRDGIITRANSAFSSLISATDENLNGTHLSDQFQVRSGNINSFIRTILETSGENAHWVTDIQGHQERWVPILISGARVEDHAGEADEGILVFSDLTQIREVERMRDDLFHGIVHELRTPLATILMYARLLREGKAQQPAKVERFLGVIERESDRLQRMIRQMLELARLDDQEIQQSATPVHLDQLFEEVLPPFADRAVQKGLLFRQRIEENLPPVLGNEEAYLNILKNLMDNAIKFTPSGTVQITAKADEDCVVIEISDEGIGIPAEAINNLFKRFYRTKTAVEHGIAGTGLGLYMVKENLQNYNGDITVSSEVGTGTTFTLRLPVAEM